MPYGSVNVKRFTACNLSFMLYSWRKRFASHFVLCMYCTMFIVSLMIVPLVAVKGNWEAFEAHFNGSGTEL